MSRLRQPGDKKEPAAGDSAGSFLPPAGIAGGTETILLVEDEDAVRALLHRLLSDLGYTVLEASTGREALELAGSSGPIHLLLTDTVMPEMSGPELVSRLLESRPGLRVVHMSGHAEEAVGRFGELPAWSHYLAKPFTATQLAIVVRAALDETASPAPPA